MLNSDRLTQDEYENQFFGFSTTDLVERFKDVVKNLIQKALSDMEKEIGMTDMYAGESTKALLQLRIDELYCVYMESAKKALNKFEEESRNIFVIPQNVLLEEDKYLVVQCPDTDIEELKSKISELEQTLICEKVYLTKCQQMKETFEITIDPIYKKMSDIASVARRNITHPKTKEPAKLQQLYNSRVQQFTGNTHDNIMKMTVTVVESNFYGDKN